MTSHELHNGVIRQDHTLSDGRIIRYYDSGNVTRDGKDLRPIEAPAGIGELRFVALVGEWVAIASHRQNRAFLPPKNLCPLCPTQGSELLTEIAESHYQVVVFDNKNPALNASTGAWALPEPQGPETPTVDGVGKCEVVVFSDEHEGSFGSLSLNRMRLVMEAWIDRTREISTLPNIVQVFPFENRGEEVGVTISHPHGQIYAYSFLTPRTTSMLNAAQEYKKKTGRILFDDIVEREIKDKKRIIAENEHWISFVPYAARYPFEIHIAPKKSVADFTELTVEQADAFPEVAKESLLRLDGVYGIEMAYMAGWHQAPVSIGRDLLRLHLQITCVRPAPNKLKYLAGSESLMGAFVMDKTPEQAAEQLQAAHVDLPL